MQESEKIDNSLEGNLRSYYFQLGMIAHLGVQDKFLFVKDVREAIKRYSQDSEMISSGREVQDATYEVFQRYFDELNRSGKF